ncbi:MAG: bifunctional nuclease family protein [Chloroflexota bacterium]
MSQHRVVILREEDGEKLIPIWIGPFEADAITLQLQGVDTPRPLTHDLLKTAIEMLDGEVMHILINGLDKNTYFANIVLDVNGDNVELDSRPSDAIALAVRVNAPLYVSDEIMDSAGLLPDDEISLTGEPVDGPDSFDDEDDTPIGDLGAFTEFVEGLDLDNILGAQRNN